jgi:prolyl-tRNA editing enzyme YbaK/EbsC (Cys-tRNA(Pro) deacylase)
MKKKKKTKLIVKILKFSKNINKNKLKKRLKNLDKEDLIHLSGYLTGIALIAITPSDALSNELLNFIGDILD